MQKRSVDGYLCIANRKYTCSYMIYKRSNEQRRSSAAPRLVAWTWAGVGGQRSGAGQTDAVCTGDGAVSGASRSWPQSGHRVLTCDSGGVDLSSTVWSRSSHMWLRWSGPQFHSLVTESSHVTQVEWTSVPQSGHRVLTYDSGGVDLSSTVWSRSPHIWLRWSGPQFHSLVTEFSHVTQVEWTTVPQSGHRVLTCDSGGVDQSSRGRIILSDLSQIQSGHKQCVLLVFNGISGLSTQ